MNDIIVQYRELDKQLDRLKATREKCLLIIHEQEMPHNDPRFNTDGVKLYRKQYLRQLDRQRDLVLRQQINLAEKLELKDILVVLTE